MKHIALTIVSCCLMLGACAQNNQRRNNTMSKSTVIFFSHAGDNYAVGNIDVGNTKFCVGHLACQKLGACVFQIKLCRQFLKLH